MNELEASWIIDKSVRGMELRRTKLELVKKRKINMKNQEKREDYNDKRSTIETYKVDYFVGKVVHILIKHFQDDLIESDCHVSVQNMIL